MQLFILILFILLLVGVIVLVRLKGHKPLAQSRNKPEYNSDLFWNAIIEWDWISTSQGWKLNKPSIVKKCPNCESDLDYDLQGGYFFLFCNECKFISNDFAYHPEAEEANAEQFFYEELEKKINQ